MEVVIKQLCPKQNFTFTISGLINAGYCRACSEGNDALLDFPVTENICT